MSQYKMPPVEIGDDVWWFPDRDTQHPHAAKVTKIGFDSICVSLFEPNTQNTLIRDGVRHVSDPRVHNDDLRDSGLFDLTPKAKRLQALEQRVGELELAVLTLPTESVQA